MLTIHGVPISVHTRKVILAANLKGLAHRVEPVIPFRPPENWRELSPTGLIPAIEDEGFRLADSTAICLYLDRTRPQAPLLPAGDQGWAQALFLDAYAGGTVFRGFVHGLFFNKVIRPNILGEPADAAEIARLRAEVEPQVFGYLESVADGGWLVGGALTLADLAVVSNLINYRYLGFAIDAADYPRLAAYFEGALREPLFAAVLAAEEPFARQMGLELGWAAQAEPA